MSGAYIASDYAGISARNIAFYYGYEETNADGDWLFIAKRNGEVVQEWTAKDIDSKDKWDCAQVLIDGIALFFNEWSVTCE